MAPEGSYVFGHSFRIHILQNLPCQWFLDFGVPWETASVIPVFGLIQSEWELPSRFKVTTCNS